MVVGLGNRKLKHVCRLNVRCFLKHRHQLRKVVELGKACFRTVAAAFRRKLDCRNGFSEGARPGVKVDQIITPQRAILQILLHRVHLYHAVADWGACGKHNTASSGQLVQIAAFHIEIRAFLCLGLADTTDVPHFRKCGKVFVVVRLVNEQPVYAELFKGNDVILSGLVVELIELLLYGLLGALQLLDGEVVASVLFELSNTFHHLVHLLFQKHSLPLQRHGDFFKL